MKYKSDNSVMNTWKPVKLEGSIGTTDFEGLVGIEECTDYDLNDILANKKGKTNKNTTKKKRQKRKRKDTENDEESSYPCEVLSPSKTGTTLDIEDDLSSMEAWNSYDLPKVILTALKEQNFTQPTAIQSQTLPAAILGRRDILGAAETGSGKTLAFGLPILCGILKLKENNSTNEAQDSDSEVESDFENLENDELGCVKSISLKNKNTPLKPLYGLVLTPTRELAMQVANHLKAVAKHTGINIAVVVGGMAAVKQERLLSKSPEIVVATPGRLWELIQQGNQHLCQIDNIKFLAIDETDRMLEKGHFQELHDLLERINTDETKKKERQTFVFSATLTLVHELPKHLKNDSKIKKKKIKEMTPEQKLGKFVDVLGITNPKIVDLSQGTGTPDTLTECRITCAIDEKDYYVYYFLKRHPGRTLIFCNSIGCVKRLTTLLNLLDCNTLPLHASMQQRQRLKNLERFRDTENGVLIATDVAARGLDIPMVEHVLHYQTPRTSESYVHRSGRTARAAKLGITVLLMEPSEFLNYIKLCRTLGKEKDLPLFPIEDNFLNAVKQRVNLARELDKLQLQVRKANSEAGWLEKAAEDMDILIDDSTRKYDTKEARLLKKSSEVKRKHLQALLSRPIFPKNVNGKYPLLNSQNLNAALLINAPEEKKALDVMKDAIENYSKEKRRTIPLYKPKKKKSGVEKTHTFKREKKPSKQKKSKLN